MGVLDIALLGLGAIGREHARVLRANPQLRLAAVADPGAGAAALCAQWQVPHYPDLASLLAGCRVDGVVLATPNTQHVEQTLQCLERGLPVLLEKPIAHSVSEAQRLVAHLDAHGGQVLIGHHRAHSAILAAALEILQTGSLGDLVCVLGSATFYKPDDYFAQASWRREPGAGPILINLIHEVHTLRMLCGEIEEVQAMTSTRRRGFAVEDTASISLRFASGALGSFMLSDVAASARSWEQTSGENPAYAHYPDEDCYVLSGTRGSLNVPTLRTKVYGDALPSWFTPFRQAQSPCAHWDPLERQMAHFAELVQGRVAPRVSARDGLMNLQVVDAIARAARSGATVRPTECH